MLIAAAIITAIVIWGMVASRGFRVLMIVGLCGLAGWLIYLSSENDKAQQAKAAHEQEDRKAEQKRQDRLWSLIRPDQIQLRDIKFSAERSGSEFILSGAVKNLSNQKLGAIEFDITARDCVKECETVGHADGVVIWVDVPPQEVRAFTAQAVDLPHMPDIKGKFVPEITVKRIYTGDLLDQWMAPR